MNNHINKKQLNCSRITIQNKLSDCARLSTFLADHLKVNSIPDTIHHDLQLVTEEIVTNIINYAYADNKKHSISIDVSNTEKIVKLTFVDNGMAFNPLENCVADIENNDHCEGSMGIHIIKSLTEQQEYSRIDQRNVFTVTKYYNQKNKTI